MASFTTDASQLDGLSRQPNFRLVRTFRKSWSRWQALRLMSATSAGRPFESNSTEPDSAVTSIASPTAP
jgi:hypothetical protein